VNDLGRLILAIAFSSLLLTASAHGPFDNSARAVLGRNALELEITLGTDAAKALLQASGVDPAAIAAALHPRGGQPALSLPLGVAERLFEVSSQGNTVKPRSIGTLTDGLEVLFVADYPPIYANASFRARYFDIHNAMPAGTLNVVDETGRTLAAAKLDASAASLNFTLPIAAGNPRSGVEVTAPEKATTPVPSAKPHANAPTQGRFTVKTGGALVLAGLLVAGVVSRRLGSRLSTR